MVAGYKSIITFLEMREPPPFLLPTLPDKNIKILRAENLSVSFYRFLYNTIGAEWKWWERRLMNDNTLSKIIFNPLVEIYVLYYKKVPAGFCELDRRINADIQIVYFGLMKEFIGRGLGGYFLRWSINKVWDYKPDRVWVHTCTEDHPAALTNYKKVGFKEYDQQTELIKNVEYLF